MPVIIEIDEEEQIQGMREEKIMSLVWDIFEVLWSTQQKTSRWQMTMCACHIVETTELKTRILETLVYMW